MRQGAFVGERGTIRGAQYISKSVGKAACTLEAAPHRAPKWGGHIVLGRSEWVLHTHHASSRLRQVRWILWPPEYVDDWRAWLDNSVSMGRDEAPVKIAESAHLQPW